MKSKRITSFDFEAGKAISNKFKIMEKLGGGWEGEVYRIEEAMTGIKRAAKFFYPQRNVRNKTVKFHAKKLHKLKNCQILIQYVTHDIMTIQGVPVTYLISDYVEGLPLCDYINQQKGKRLTAYQAIHLLHALAVGVEEIHRLKEYHGDLHTGNVIVQRHGLGFDLKLLDFYQHGVANKDNYQSDLLNLIRLFYDSLGGHKHYSKQPKEIKQIICGLKEKLILLKFKNILRLRSYIENMSWD